MIVSYRKWVNRAKFILLFVCLTFVLYHVLSAVSAWLGPLDKYHEPTGRAEKVFRHVGGIQESESISDRLRFFYWYGE